MEAKFGQSYQEKINRCQVFTDEWDGKISNYNGRNKALRSLFERQIERQESIMRMVGEMVADSQATEETEN